MAVLAGDPGVLTVSVPLFNPRQQDGNLSGSGGDERGKHRWLDEAKETEEAQTQGVRETRRGEEKQIRETGGRRRRGARIKRSYSSAAALSKHLHLVAPRGPVGSSLSSHSH